MRKTAFQIEANVGLTTPEPTPTPPPKGGFSVPADGPKQGVTLGVFAKHWTPGTTKTRLAASIGPDAAAAASRCFVETILTRLATLRADDHLLAFSPAEQADAFAALPAVAGGPWRCEPQATGSLGNRMAAFFDRASGAALLVGSDSPDMPLGAVRDAIDWLSKPTDRGRLVLGPTSDGGYWLIGVRGVLPPIFTDMPWSDESLLEVTKERLTAAGWHEGTDYRFVEPWYDVDEADDLLRLREGLPDGDAPLLRLADQLDALLGPS